ncbi:MAG TPA: hypothetical protein VGH74_13360, partial [Planctomycetaceae bacterium]
DFVPQQRFEPDGNTIGLYHCDEGTGGILNDSSGNGNPGVVYGTTWELRSAPVIQPENTSRESENSPPSKNG